MILNSLIVFILILIVLVLLVYIFYLKYIKKYTRERFAFVGLTSILSLVSAYAIQLTSSQGLVSSIVNISNAVFSVSFQPYETDFKDNILVFILILVYINFIKKVFKNWNGPISEASYNKQRFKQGESIFEEATLQLKDWLSKNKIIVKHVEEDSSYREIVFINRDEEKIPWHEQASELLRLSDKQYKIDINTDYYTKEKCFLSKYGVDNKQIAILCILEYPNESTIMNFKEFLDSQDCVFDKLIVAIKTNRTSNNSIERFGKTFHVITESELLENLVDISDYSNFIKQQFETQEISTGSKLALKDFYVKLSGADDENAKIDDVEDYVLSWVKDQSENKHLAILGEYGCGKSVVSLKITYELLHVYSELRRLPILLELRGKSPRNLSLSELISNWAVQFRIDPHAVLKLHKSGRLLIIFEGFDEMDMVGDKELRLNHFQRLWEFAIPKSKIIITGRPNFFLDDKEMKVNLGIGKPIDKSHYCQAIFLDKLDKNKIVDALRKVDKGVRDQIIEVLNSSSEGNFYDLISRPAILYLVSVIWKERKLSEIREGINSATVISEFIQYVYSRQGGKKMISPLTEKEREYFMLGIAAGMLMISNFANQINKLDLEAIVTKLYNVAPEKELVESSAIKASRKSLKERMADNTEALETILTDVRSCGLLVKDLLRADYFKFAHKSYFEYQVSWFYVESLLQTKDWNTLIANSITTALGIRASNFKHSKETIAFSAEIIATRLKMMNNNNPKLVCRKIYQLVFSHTILNRFPKFSTFFELYGFVFSFFGILGVIGFFIFGISVPHSAWAKFFPFLVIVFSILSMFFAISAIRKHKNKRLGVIWFQCCRHLNVSYQVMESVTSSKYLEYLRTTDIDKH